MSSKQPPVHKFTSSGIIVTDHRFGTFDAADDHFDQFKKGELPSYDPIYHPDEITTIRDNPIDAAIELTIE